MIQAKQEIKYAMFTIDDEKAPDQMDLLQSFIKKLGTLLGRMFVLLSKISLALGSDLGR